MKMIDKVVNDKYYGKIDTENTDWRRMYFYLIAFLSFPFFSLTVSGVSNY